MDKSRDRGSSWPSKLFASEKSSIQFWEAERQTLGCMQAEPCNRCEQAEQLDLNRLEAGGGRGAVQVGMQPGCKALAGGGTQGWQLVERKQQIKELRTGTTVGH